MKNMDNDEGISRRKFLNVAAGATAMGAIAGCSALSSPQIKSEQSASNRKRVLRIAHLTDIHATENRGAPEGLEMCLKHVHNLSDRPDVIFTGGDDVMDALNEPEDSVRSQWNVWKNAFEKHCSIPVYHCLGNHDIWGWNKEKSQTTGNEALYGKNWAQQSYDVKRHYRSFDMNGWHFLFIDSMVYDGGTSYYAKLDEEQFKWLESDLAATPQNTPILILSHIPILSACVFYDGDNAKDDWVVPRAWMHIDSARINDLFNKHKNIKLCLSGHLHLYERVLYNDITYLCNGAVCGGWWKGPYKQTDAGYGILNLYDNGTFENEYIEYGWQPIE